jgi:SAM-dependent methyltransferase
MSHPFAEQQRRHWDGVAAGWAAWLEWTEENFAPLTNWLTMAAGWTPGARVLDAACGAGYPALAAAARVAPDGRVIGTDLSLAMVEAAARRASARGLSNLSIRQMDAEHLDFGNATFDAVTNVYGLMFSPDPIGALVEARRVLKPGGRLAIVVWDKFEESPFFHVITTVARPLLGLAIPDASLPGPFRFASTGALDEVLQRAGFSDCRIDALRMTFTCDSVDEYVGVFRDIAWKSRLDALSPDALARFIEDVGIAAKGYQVNGRLQLPAGSRCAVARK